MSSLLAFTVDHWHCALPLASVERSYRAAAVSPLPGAPDKVMGIVNVHGEVHPVIDLRHCLGIAPKPISPLDHMIVGRTARRLVVMVVNHVIGLVDCQEKDIVAADTVLPELPYVSGIARLSVGLLLIQDLDRFLSLEEEAALDKALET